MTPEATRSIPVADKMKSVKVAWDKVPSGPKNDAPPKHCQAAEKSDTAHNDAETTRHLDAAAHALA